MPLLLTRKRLNGIIVINVVFAGLVFLALKLLIKSEIRINFEFIGAIIAVSIITFCEFIFYAKSKQLSFKNAFTDIWNLLGGNLKVAFLFLILLVAFFYSYFLYGDQFTPANFYYAKPPANTLNSTTHGSLLSDPINSFLPTLYLIKDELLQKGKISFWNSYSGMGFSSTEAVAAAFGYFPYWIIIFLPKSIGLLAFNLFKMFICLWGMYLFLGRLNSLKLPGSQGQLHLLSPGPSLFGCFGSNRVLPCLLPSYFILPINWWRGIKPAIFYFLYSY